jgi:hypothetical protein
MLRGVVLVTTDVSEERIVFIIRVTRIGGNADYFHLDNEGARFLRNFGSYKTTRCSIPEDGILHSHRRENLKSYIALTGWAL